MTTNTRKIAKTRDQQIINFLGKWKVCSTNQIAKIFFNENARPQMSAQRVLKRLNDTNKILSVTRSKDECNIHTLNPSPIHHRSNQLNHQLKIVDYVIEVNNPTQILLEPLLGSYEPDIFYKDHMNRSVCVEIQLSKISKKRMQEKINNFMNEYGKNHDSKILYICSHIKYKDLTSKKDFKIIQRNLPNIVVF